jgi:hypothetical protein
MTVGAVGRPEYRAVGFRLGGLFCIVKGDLSQDQDAVVNDGGWVRAVGRASAERLPLVRLTRTLLQSICDRTGSRFEHQVTFHTGDPFFGALTHKIREFVLDTREGNWYLFFSLPNQG